MVGVASRGRGFRGRRGAGWGGGTCLPPQEDEAAPAAAGVAGHRGPPPRAAASATVPSRGACSEKSPREAQATRTRVGRRKDARPRALRAPAAHARPSGTRLPPFCPRGPRGRWAAGSPGAPGACPRPAGFSLDLGNTPQF